VTRRLAGRTALVTGAGSGIGRATALAMAAEGARVVCFDLDAESARATAQQVTEGGGEATDAAGDVSDAAAVTATFQALDERGWVCDTLFSGAGVDRVAGDGFDDAMTTGRPQITLMDKSAWDRMLEIHLGGAFLFTREVVRRLVDVDRGGTVTFVSSIAGTAGWGTVHYAAAKAALLGMTRALARELGPRRIRVNAICPGVIDTPMVQGLAADLVAGLQMLTPLGRLGTPEEVAALAVHLASDESAFTTGQAISPNGGLVMT
jgi:3-oxoacyl-[acyl-carrier protein] reductase